ncbi:glycosyltransferase family 2 protein [Candidatus Gottesmanbacteria bacterium]|nr:glycosyltransferase family 2 protein [Candidatus Gottesmanbacteria bacterium]
MSNPLVTIVLVNWNGIQYLPDCLNSLGKIRYRNTEILFVDNASTDNSVSYVKKNFPKIRVIQNKVNLGFAEGHEEALKQAKGDSILLLSTDTIVEPNVLDVMVKSLYEKKDIGAVQPKLLISGENNKIDSIGMFFMTSGWLYHFGRAKDAALPRYNVPMEIFSAKGACMLFKRKVLDCTGLFDKDYFAYFEETDLCHRIWLSGYRIIYTPHTSVIHKGGGSSGQMMRSYIYFHSYKNRICTYIKNLSMRYLPEVLIKTLVSYVVVVFMYVITGSFSNAAAVMRSVYWNIVNLPKTLEKRKYIQTEIRRVVDDDFLPRITRKVRLSYYYYLFFDLARYVD